MVGNWIKWKHLLIFFSVSRNYVIPSRLHENQIHAQNHLSGFTAIQELAELDESLEAAVSGNSGSQNSSRNNSPSNDYYEHHEGSEAQQLHSSADFYDMEAYTGDIGGEKREGGAAMVAILPWKGVRKNSTASSKVTLSD